MNRIHDLAQIDLNLLVALDALIDERHVTRAAGRVGVTQSAMSHTLRRLRALLGDPLLVRGVQGMALTPRAEALRVPVRSGLVTLERALTMPLVFDAATAEAAFRLATPDLFDSLVLPSLLATMRVEAPRVDLAVVPLDMRALPADLETGEVSVAVVAVPAERDPTVVPTLAATGLRERTLFRDSFSCFLRSDHPALTPDRQALSLEGFAAASHVMVSPRGTGPGLVDGHLKERGLSRRVALRVPHFASAPQIIAESDLILTAPTSLARLLAVDTPLVCVRPPVPIEDHRVVLTWHQRLDNDPANRWLRTQLIAGSSGLGVRHRHQ
ncbi:MAG: DNA-binding transcriptional LysR family regulator [Myxococcota bacterium]|jgi:DNA-binding transcriptional LysR family regulator